jgi:tetratricopeptide (TPR) repeat protein
MLREMAEALEVIAAETPLVLMLEDLHWSDPSTLDLISTVARRNELARLMIVGTYRPVEMLAGEHPLRAVKEELELHQQCIELRVPLLSEGDVAAYLAQRFSDGKEIIAPAVYARSEGNPLFMVNVVDYLFEHGSLANADKIEVPRNIRQMIERNFQRLSLDEQHVLEAACVVGAKFSAAAVAAALERQTPQVETCCAALSQREQFIRTAGRSTWPDGTVASNFQFDHALYRETLYARLPASHSIELYRRTAERMEAAYDGQVNEIAAELAEHYRRANNGEKATNFFRMAGDRAVEMRAYREAAQYFRNAISALESLPESRARDARELPIEVALAQAMQASHGYGATETVAVYRRARALAESAGGEQSMEVLYGQYVAMSARAELQSALALSNEMIELAGQIGTARFLVIANYALGQTLHFLGDLPGARFHLSQALNYEREEDFLEDMENPRINVRIIAGTNEMYLGYPERALHYLEEAISLARRLDKPLGLAFADVLGSASFLDCGYVEKALGAGREAVELSAQLGMPLYEALGKLSLARAFAHSGQRAGAADEVRDAIRQLDLLKFYLARTWFTRFLGETQSLAGEVEAAFASVDAGLRLNVNELTYRPDSLRLRGELCLRRQATQVEVAECDFREALRLSRQIEAKLPELRATTSLARLLRDTGRSDEARTILAEIYGWFTEGFDTKDLKEAKTLLDELSAPTSTQPQQSQS